MLHFAATIWRTIFPLNLSSQRMLPNHPPNIEKTVVRIPFGAFKINRLPFGFHNAGHTLQRMMDRMLAVLDFALACVDDIIFASRSHAEHLIHLHLLLERLQRFGLATNSNKCLLRPDFSGLSGPQSVCQGRSSTAQPCGSHSGFSTAADGQAAPGFPVNLCNRFLPAAAQFLRLLSDSLRESRKSQEEVQWLATMETGFQTT
jgi:hypothetical protein